MVVWRLVIMVMCASACDEAEPLERLAPRGVRTFEPNPWKNPPPPPPPPPRVKPVGPPPQIAALVRDRFGAPEVTLFELAYADDERAADFMGYVIVRSAKLELAQAVALVERLAGDESFMDGYDACACGRLGVRITRGSEHLDFVVNGTNVSVAGEGDVGALATDVRELVDKLNVAVLR